MKKVLCVCADNTARSPMMAALLQRELGNEFQVESAGVQPGCAGQRPEVYAIQCMLERGIDIRIHRSRRIFDDADNLVLYGAEYIVCVSEKIENEIILYLAGDRVTKLIIANEAGGGIRLSQRAGIDEYRKCAAMIDGCVLGIANQIRSYK